jgi:phosphatidylglycerophosphatase A
MRVLARFIATLGPVGSAPIAPATAGSAVVVLVGYFIPVRAIPAFPVALLLILACAALAVWSAGEAEMTLGHDAKPIVIDEVVGQSLALLFVPHSPLAFLAAFVIFRVFDVWKPLGAREIQRLPGGWGVVADDVVAGLSACGAFHLGYWALRQVGTFSV